MKHPDSTAQFASQATLMRYGKALAGLLSLLSLSPSAFFTSPVSSCCNYSPSIYIYPATFFHSKWVLGDISAQWILLSLALMAAV